ncbi:MAG: DUF971 domain-containing protein [Bacteroidetes bacterium]|nr:DUF971 domain-containing protein [Bacteroidota bacterium]
MYNRFAPKAITKPHPSLISAEWGDGFTANITLEKLREECPCALCKDEREKKSKEPFPMLKTFVKGMNELKALDKVGNYAVTAKWGDGHDTGIYTWDQLREIFEKHALKPEELKKFE